MKEDARMSRNGYCGEEAPQMAAVARITPKAWILALLFAAFGAPFVSAQTPVSTLLCQNNQSTSGYSVIFSPCAVTSTGSSPSALVVLISLREQSQNQAPATSVTSAASGPFTPCPAQSKNDAYYSQSQMWYLLNANASSSDTITIATAVSPNTFDAALVQVSGISVSGFDGCTGNSSPPSGGATSIWSAPAPPAATNPNETYLMAAPFYLAGTYTASPSQCSILTELGHGALASCVFPNGMQGTTPSISGNTAATYAFVGLALKPVAAQVSVPNVVGMTQTTASTNITSAGLVLGTVTMQTSSTVAAGSVISESPAAGTLVGSGSAVSLGVSSGATQVSVPNVVGMTQATATTTITGQGLVLGTVTMQTSSTVAAGSVISESPAAGTLVGSGSAVSLVVSSGATQVSVPNVVGMTQATATTTITGQGLVLGTVR